MKAAAKEGIGNAVSDYEKCSECGLCKANCPVYKALLDESVSARGKAKLMKGRILSGIFFVCTLCKACKQLCPANLDLDFEGERERLIADGKETDSNKRMIGNIRKYGNPFGKAGERPKELHCC
ncbi:MAG: 4Fe-4S dicluster domain-containing protein [Candidatus Diapherotrites archaeon]|uniref:4Fe-4S dicluster domain-containing protein n=1 Tax=Candidatus Iainarchaeum sp. TaxID=3101447 RepID=A0A8T4L2Q8_9ARCH|nr:4Fe-4S dicluster domain-containing protein [Candidatus Diapherotrites archaeon]